MKKYFLILCCILTVVMMVGCNKNAKEKSNDVIETTSKIENQSDKEFAWKESITDESITEQVTLEESTTENSTEPISTEVKTEKATEKETEKVTTAHTVATTQAVTESITQKETEEQTTEKVTTPNPKTLLKTNNNYIIYIECYDVQVWEYGISFTEDGMFSSFLREAYMLESSWQGEKTEEYITYNGAKYYPVGAGGGGFYGTYSLTDEAINIVSDIGGSITFTMTTEGNIVVDSVNGINDMRFVVGNIFVLQK